MTVPPRYLGDGVYASFDGYHIWLTTQREGGEHLIALDYDVLASLDEFRAAIAKLRGAAP